jgi:tetratricopeptide (TPR) repeat protein
LEGLPLAIELAAVRVKVLSPEAILSRLDHRLSLLVGGKSDLPHRHQALETAIAWSYNLLDHREKAIFRGLSVFAGGWSLEAAEKVVCNEEAAEISILEGVTSLLNKSLIVRIGMDDAGGGGDPYGDPRFSMLETIREYARERLRESGKESALERAHALYYRDLAERAEPHLLRGAKQAEWLDRIEGEHDNLRAALHWARTTAMRHGEAGGKAAAEALEIGLRIVGGVWRLWLTRGYQSEGKAHVSQTLAAVHSLAAMTPTHTGQPDAMGHSKRWQQYIAKVNYAGGTFAFHEDDYIAARSYHEHSLTLRREVDDKEGIGSALNSLGMVVEAMGDYAGASALCEEALAIRREIDDRHGVVHSLQAIGRIALVRGDYSEARSHLAESLDLARQIDEKLGVGWALHWLGFIAEIEEEYASARSLYQQSLNIWQEIGYKLAHAYTTSCMGSVAASEGDRATACSLYKESLTIRRELGDRYGISVCIVGLGEVAVGAAVETQQRQYNSWSSEQVENGVKLLAAAEAILSSIGAHLGVNERRVYDRGIAAARELLDEAAFARAWAQGRAMSVEQAIDLAQIIF